MSASSCCVGRREGLLALAGLVLSAPAVALPSWPQRGQGRMRFLGLAIYDIALSAPERVQPEAWAAQPLLLTLRYQRSLKGAAIAERSLTEMRRQGAIDDAQAQAWLAGMRDAFPDVADGDRLAGLHDPADGARFWFNGAAVGPRFDAAFSRRFFGIWLAPQTSEPALRRQLLGL